MHGNHPRGADILTTNLGGFLSVSHDEDDNYVDTGGIEHIKPV